MTERRRRFSERIGHTAPPGPQLNEMGEALRNSLWNLVRQLVPQRPSHHQPGTWSARSLFVRELARDFFKTALTESQLHEIQYRAMGWFETAYFRLEWAGVYDLLEHFVERAHVRAVTASEELARAVNVILEQENAGYRFAGGQLVPITSEAELGEVAAAREKASGAGLDAVRLHIDNALSALGRRPDPDHRTAIKEAISAVESVAKLIEGRRGGTLEPALDALAAKTGIHPALKEAFRRLYGYTSDADGIRHALLEAPKLDAADARFMVIACSAFVHFLIEKAEGAGLLQPQPAAAPKSGRKTTP